MIIEVLAAASVAALATDRWHRTRKAPVARPEPVRATESPAPPIEFFHDDTDALVLRLCRGAFIEHEIHTHAYDDPPETYAYGGKTYTFSGVIDGLVLEYQR